MSEYQIAHTGAVNTSLLDAEMRAALPNKIEGLVVAVGSFVTVNFTNTPSAQDQTDAAAVVAAHDPDAETPLQIHHGLIASLLASFSGNGAEAEYFINLQAGLETVLTNGTALATFYHAMLANLKANSTYYQGYINLLEESTTVTQAQIDLTPPTLPTAAQMRAAYNAAMLWKDAGMWRVLLSAINKGVLRLG